MSGLGLLLVPPRALCLRTVQFDVQAGQDSAVVDLLVGRSTLGHFSWPDVDHVQIAYNGRFGKSQDKRASGISKVATASHGLRPGLLPLLAPMSHLCLGAFMVASAWAGVYSPQHVESICRLRRAALGGTFITGYLAKSLSDRLHTHTWGIQPEYKSNKKVLLLRVLHACSWLPLLAAEVCQNPDEPSRAWLWVSCVSACVALCTGKLQVKLEQFYLASLSSKND
eukprot:jgi/Mesvir1/23613/Mv18295-RA.1